MFVYIIAAPLDLSLHTQNIWCAADQIMIWHIRTCQLCIHLQAVISLIVQAIQAHYRLYHV